MLAASLPCSAVAQEEKLDLRRSQEISAPSSSQAIDPRPRESEPLKLKGATGIEPDPARSAPQRVTGVEEGQPKLRRFDEMSAPVGPRANDAEPREAEPLILRSAPGLAPEPAQARSAPQRVSEMLLQADVNQQRLDDSVIVLKAEDGTVLLAGEDLDR